MIVELAGDDLVAGGADGGQLFGGHLFGLELGVGLGGSLFQNAEGMGDFAGHGFDVHTDFEVFMAALGLGSPEPVGRDLDLAHGVVFDTVFHLLFHLCCCEIRS